MRIDMCSFCLAYKTKERNSMDTIITYSTITVTRKFHTSHIVLSFQSSMDIFSACPFELTSGI